MSTTTLTNEQIQFIDQLAELLGTWSLTTNAARLYGYLQIVEAPVSLDDIARDLEISRSHAYSAAKILELHGNARGIPTRGSRRVMYVCGDDPGVPLQRQIATLARMSELIAARGVKVAKGEAKKRVARLGQFHGQLHKAMLSVVSSK